MRLWQNDPPAEPSNLSDDPHYLPFVVASALDLVLIVVLLLVLFWR